MTLHNSDIGVASTPRVASVRLSVAHMEQGATRLLKKLVWIYFLLLIFEGALRKWFLPGLATPLLVVRDPIAGLILVMSWRNGLLPSTPYLFGMVLVTVVAALAALAFGHANLWVTLYGARILILHYPIIFAIGKIFTREDVIQIGRAMLWLAIPMAVLIILQFYSPQSAWVNRGVGGDVEGAGFSGAMGFYRPAGTFSFTNGTTLFFGLAASFILAFWMQVAPVSRMLLILATGSLIVAIPLSISRSLFFGVGVSLLFTGLALMRNPRFLLRLVWALAGIVVLLVVLNQYDFFRKAIEVFTARFVMANESEGGLDGVLLDRYFGGLLGAISQSATLPFFGYGLGLGTNVGSMLTRGEVLYLIAEGEWGRLVGELGPFLGIVVIALRLGLSAKLSFAAYFRIKRGDLLPWILLSFGLLVIPQGQWGQPTTLGFSCLTGGLIIASFRRIVRAQRENITTKNTAT